MDANLPQANAQTQTGNTAANTRQSDQSLANDIIQTQRDLAAAAVGSKLPDDAGQSQPSAAGYKPQDASDQISPVSGPKEQKELGPITAEPEKITLIEHKEPEPGDEVKDWMQKVEEGESVQLPQAVIDDFGQVLVEAAVKQKPKIVLPLDEENVKKGLHHKAADSIKWLAEWCLRVMKMASGRVFYKQ